MSTEKENLRNRQAITGLSPPPVFNIGNFFFRYIYRRKKIVSKNLNK